jgi:hypothetical protein
MALQAHVIICGQMGRIASASPNEIITVHDIGSEVASVLATDFVEITRYMKRYVITVKKRPKLV